MSRDRRPRRTAAPDRDATHSHPAPHPAPPRWIPLAAWQRPLRIGLVAYTIFAGAVLLTGVTPSPWTWGVHTLAFLPRFVWFAAALAFAALAWPAPAARCADAMFGVARWVLDRWVRIAIGALAAGFAFWLLRLRFPFLGDGIVWIDKIEHGDTFFHFEPLATAVVTTVARWAKTPRSAAGYPAIGCGVLYLVGVAWLVRHLWKESGPRALAATLLVAHPLLLLWFGYIESYPILLVLQVGFAIALATGTGSWRMLVGSALFLGVAIASHLQALAWMPALWLAAWMGSDAGGDRRAGALSALAASLIALGVAALVVQLLGASPFALVRKLAGSTGMGGVGAAAFFAPRRGLEMLNEVALLLAPQLLVGVPALAAGALRREPWGAPWPALVALLPGPLSFFLLVPARIGGGRDWDLYAALVLPVTLLAAELWRRAGGADSRLPVSAPGRVIAGRALGAAAVVTAAWLAVQLDTPRAARRMIVLQRSDGPFSRFARGYANETLGIYYRDIDVHAARDAYARAVEANPVHPRYLNNLANTELALDNVEAARDAFRRARDAGMREWFVLYNLSLLELRLGDPNEARRLSEEVVQGWPKRPEGWASRAQVQIGTGEPAAALESLDHAITLAPRNPSLQYLRGVAYRDLGRFDAARSAWQAALRLDPNDESTRRALATLPPPGFEARPR